MCGARAECTEVMVLSESGWFGGVSKHGNRSKCEGPCVVKKAKGFGLQR